MGQNIPVPGIGLNVTTEFVVFRNPAKKTTKKAKKSKSRKESP